MSETERTHLELRLLGSRYGDGEIPLDDLARIATETQRLVRRLARALTDRGAAGRTPAAIEELTSLLLVDLRDGSTVLDIAGPPLQAELDLGDDVPVDVGSQAVELLLETVAAFSDPLEPLPEVVAGPVAQSFSAWFSALEDYGDLLITGRFVGEEREVLLTPAEGRRRLQGTVPDDVASEVRQSYVVEGRLYAVNLRTNRYALEDDSGQTVHCIVDEGQSEEAAHWLGRRVRASGDAVRDDKGRLQSLTVAELTSAEEIEGLDPERFWRTTSLEELLSGAEPLESIDDLLIDGLTEEQEQAFLRALRE